MDLAGDLKALQADLAGRIEQVVADAESRVVEWRSARRTPLPRRLEPFLHERLWCPRGAFVEDAADERYGYDAAGEVVLVDRNEFVLRAPGTVLTVLLGGDRRPYELIRHVLDGDRLVRTDYLEGTETYEYDAERLVAIDEFDSLWTTTTGDPT